MSDELNNMVDINLVKDFSVSNQDKINEDNERRQLEDEINRLNDINKQISSLESYKKMILQTKSCNRDDYQKLVLLGISQESLPHENSYTQDKSFNNYEVTLESIGNMIKFLLAKALDVLIIIVAKIWNMFSRIKDRHALVKEGLEQNAKNAYILQGSLKKSAASKKEIENLYMLPPAVYSDLKDRVAKYCASKGVEFQEELFDVTRLEDLFLKLSILVLNKITDDTVNDGIRNGQYFNTLSSFVNKEHSAFINSLYVFVNKEKPNKPLSAKYTTSLEVSLPDNVPDVKAFETVFKSLTEKYSGHDYAGVTFMEVIGNMKVNMLGKGSLYDFFDKKKTSFVIERFKEVKVIVSSGEIDENYRQTFNELSATLDDVKTLVDCLNSYNESILKTVSGTSELTKFQADILRSLGV